jgi:hypothetical protein
MENAELNNHRQHMEGADDFDCDDNPVNAASGELDPQTIAPPRLPSPPPSTENSSSSPPQEAEAVASSSSLPPSPPSSSSASEPLAPLASAQQEAAELPRILPMDEDDGDGAGHRADNDENVHRHPISTSHDGLPEILPLDGFAAAAAAQHRPAQDVMPAFGQLMGNDVRPGLATPAYLRQPTLHYNKRRRRGHDYAQPPPPPPSASAAAAGTRTQRIA